MLGNVGITFYNRIFDNWSSTCVCISTWNPLYALLLLLVVGHELCTLSNLVFFFLSFLDFKNTVNNYHTNQLLFLNLRPFIACCFALLGPWYGISPLAFTLDAAFSVTMLFIEGVLAVHPHHGHLLAVRFLFFVCTAISWDQIYKTSDFKTVWLKKTAMSVFPTNKSIKKHLIDI